ncbi:ABC transporter ATP-binding protein [Idiomarina tyrosinivorans]|uniref:ATP-binding protein Uup n=1 Tax=Idiomarina tyrosinivorans TaxID=1445662 RepID=A0A432ZTQ6_9GAMM|nr:ABC transporter ATP-binding protein [Idiomarina tyrosinivorans]RUO81300.1 ABC transporter ATP-binding protein [Idiomarina tyrosinivorans]
MNLLRIQDAELSYGTQVLLDQVQLTVDAGERVCLVGRNGAGKSTLMKVIAGEILLDSGTVQAVGETVITRLPQDPPAQSDDTVYHYVADALADVGALLDEYNQLSAQIAEDASEHALKRLDQLQTAIDAADGWQYSSRIESVLSRLNLQPNQVMNTLSGGWLRRVALARALVVNPDILLLDEPTNHLDIEMVKWLEQQLKEFTGAIVFISHDRAFIRALATRIVDLDRGHLSSFPGDYDRYLSKKAEALDVEANQRAEFDKKLAEEEAWIRQGIKARRTRNEGRVRALKALRNERKQRRELQGNAKMQANEAGRSGKRVFEGEGLHLAFDDKTILQDFSLNLQRGDKIALVGPNGVGKSTLIRVILGEQAVDSGQVKLGTNLEVAYFDQHRDQLDPQKTVMDNVGDGKQDIQFQGRSRHILSYLQDFLFSPAQSRTPVRALSGGERNRALLAKILLKPSNVLVLDEPTNDLDIETLELLEQILAEYQGTVILVSHDREFVDNTATSVLYFEGEGKVTEIIGGFTELSHYLTEREPSQGTKIGAAQSEPQKEKKSTARKGSAQPSKKLSYKLKRELELLPQQIDELEQQLAELQAVMNEPDFFSQPHEKTEPVLNDIAEIEAQLMSALERWDELEKLAQESS